jgi:hypothetical protein
MYPQPVVSPSLRMPVLLPQLGLVPIGILLNISYARFMVSFFRTDM